MPGESHPAGTVPKAGEAAPGDNGKAPETHKPVADSRTSEPIATPAKKDQTPILPVASSSPQTQPSTSTAATVLSQAPAPVSPASPSKAAPSAPPQEPQVIIQKTELPLKPPSTVPLAPLSEESPATNTNSSVETLISIRKTDLTNIAVAPEDHLCPNCQHRYREGELACPHCGHILTTKGKTTKMEEEAEPQTRKNWPPGDVQAMEKKPITFEIGDQQVTIFVSEILIVGRASDVPGDFTPDVDLNLYRGGELGVSRRHVRIRRRGSFIYIADLNSTNGTLLNGRRLIPEGERLLRSGDELRLGHLKMTIRF